MITDLDIYRAANLLIDGVPIAAATLMAGP
jgi:hypothetical protein